MQPGCRHKPRAVACAQLAGLLPGGTAGSDSGKATTRVIRRGPFHHHHQPARHSPNCPRPSSPHHPAERRLVVVSAALANRSHMEARFATAVCCYRLYGDITLKLRRTENCLARERSLGNEAAKIDLWSRT